MAAMMVLLRELDLETDSDVGVDGLVLPGGSLFIQTLSRTTDSWTLLMCLLALCLAGLNLRISLSQLLGSSSAVSVVCQAVCHLAMTRTLFCRDLLILQKLYLRFGDNVRTHTCLSAAPPYQCLYDHIFY